MGEDTHGKALRSALRERIRTWLVTGAAGFIGSHLVEQLLGLGQVVVGLDDLSTGHLSNLRAILAGLSGQERSHFRLELGDVRDPAACARACADVDIVLHQAALGSVPRSIRDPLQTHDVNVTGFVRIVMAAREAGIRRLVFASSSSVYGDHPGLPKVEEVTGRPLSPYAASKRADELYADAFAACFDLELIGLRYFNVFGPRQDPSSQYAAVIPLWFSSLLAGTVPVMFGDGETSRDFCYVDNVVQANLLAAVVEDPAALRRVYNVACGEQTTLNELFRLIREQVARFRPEARAVEPIHRPSRAGDVRHSLADVAKARTLLGYAPLYSVRDGLRHAAEWYASAAETTAATADRSSPAARPTPREPDPDRTGL